jgi:hypothetical protein
VFESNGEFRADGWVGIFGDAGGEIEQRGTSSAQGAEGEQALAGIGGVQQRADFFYTSIAKLSEQPNRAGGDEGIAMRKQGRDGFDGSGAEGLEAAESDVAGIECGALQGGELASGGLEIGSWDLWFEALGRDAVDGAAAGFIEVL